MIFATLDRSLYDKLAVGLASWPCQNIIFIKKKIKYLTVTLHSILIFVLTSNIYNF